MSFFPYNVVELQCLVYISTRENISFLLKESKITIFGNFKSVFQLDHQVDLNVHLIEATVLHFPRELAFLTPSLCIYGPIYLLILWTIKSTSYDIINFVSSECSLQVIHDTQQFGEIY
jgi:hypothetical protein